MGLRPSLGRVSFDCSSLVSAPTHTGIRPAFLASRPWLAGPSFGSAWWQFICTMPGRCGLRGLEANVKPTQPQPPCLVQINPHRWTNAFGQPRTAGKESGPDARMRGGGDKRRAVKRDTPQAGAKPHTRVTLALGVTCPGGSTPTPLGVGRPGHCPQPPPLPPWGRGHTLCGRKEVPR